MNIPTNTRVLMTEGQNTLSQEMNRLYRQIQTGTPDAHTTVPHFFININVPKCTVIHECISTCRSESAHDLSLSLCVYTRVLHTLHYNVQVVQKSSTVLSCSSSCSATMSVALMGFFCKSRKLKRGRLPRHATFVI